ncbi:unnamed protein product [Rotaria sp. Silwood2]|nr:unnamed protein product [Rotaria sp. Silwood2]
MVCYICLRHNDPNVVSSLLETLEIILKYSNWIDRRKSLLHLLSVREHGDPHLRGAYANLLAKLIQTTVHL